MPQPHDLSTPLAYALAYAEMGWHVLPLEPGTKIPLGRLVPRGMLDATTDAETIRGWWRRHPQANIGIALAQSGLVAIDIDPRNGGVETFEQLQAAHGNLRSSVQAFTGGGGEHHVFVIPPGAQLNLPGTLGPGVDLKANGYIVAEPSIHPNGRRYDWEASSSPLDGAVPSPLPDWLRSLRVELQQPQARPGDVPVDAAQARDVREALYLLDADDYAEWLHAGMALHSTRWGHPAFALWCAWSQQSDKFDSTVCRRKWESFSSDAERGDLGITLAWVFKTAQTRGWANPRAGSAAQVASTPHSVPDDLLLDIDELFALANTLRWQVKHAVPENSLGMIFGASGTFKSFIALDYALHIAHGMPWLGRRTKPGRVVYVAAEGGAGLAQRITAWHKHHGLDPHKIARRFFTCRHALVLSQPDQIVALREKIAAIVSDASSIIIDTLSQTFGGNENAADEMAGFFRLCGTHLREPFGAAVWLVHHTGHMASERPRGTSAITAAVDFLFGVFRQEGDMLATMEFHKVKEGDKPQPVNFALTRHELGRDEDGDMLSSLCAHEVRNTDELLETMTQKGDSQRAVFLRLLAGNSGEAGLRSEFYEALGAMDPAAKRQAWKRQRDFFVKNNLAFFGEGRCFLLDKDNGGVT